MSETSHTPVRPDSALKYIGFIPLMVLIHDIAILLLGIFSFGRLPIYGKDPDPSSLNIVYDTFFGISGVFGMMISALIIALDLFITLHIIICRIKISRAELYGVCIPYLVVGWHLFFRFCFPQSFEWVMD